MKILKKIWSGIIYVFSGRIFRSKKDRAKEAIEMHEKMTEKQVDKMVKDSFPASDPPSTY